MTSVHTPPFKVLFLCTANSARSILSEALLRHEGKERFQSFSAGSKPSSKVNPVAVQLLAMRGIPIDGLSSKSWHIFEGESAPQMDFVFTVCGNARDEECPVWPGHPVTAHWGISDPAAVTGSDVERLAAFESAYALLQKKIRMLIALPLENMSDSERRAACKDIGDIL
ncbi:MAG: hypothetical protein AUJ12_06130 [Alphaproteobacteria bacterium CG1_02_46_17]|nr:MAG: hypothetical protein AUJ12_06130 [Alphaproteobacteria bacterium CG1_02_46_17]